MLQFYNVTLQKVIGASETTQRIHMITLFKTKYNDYKSPIALLLSMRVGNIINGI